MRQLISRRCGHICLILVLSQWLTQAAVLDSAKAVSEALKYVEKNEKRFIKDLIDLVAIPSVSASSKHLPDVEKSAAWVVKRLKKAGLQNVKLLKTGGHGHPSVYADWLSAGPQAPTVLVYAHHDVQPAEPLDLWHSPPFKPEVRDGVLYGRGAEDCKGGLLQPVQAVESLLSTSGQLPVNLKLILEGQEEIGSPDLVPLLQEHKELLAADIVLSADGAQPSKTQGSVTLGLRGAVGLEVKVSALHRDVHSGLLGGAVVNSALALSRLLATLHNEDGSIAVEGYLDDVQPMSEADRADASSFPWDEGEQLAAVGAMGSTGQTGYSALERTWFLPSIDVVGMYSGHTGEGSKTILPAVATAKLSSRLVPNQDPERCSRLIADHLVKHAPRFTNVTVTTNGFSAGPYAGPRDSLANRAIANVLEPLLGSKPLFQRSGGSIPALSQFKKVLGTDTAMFAFGLPDSNIHAPNERYPLDFFAKGREGYVRILFEIAKLHGHAAEQATAEGKGQAKGEEGGAGRDEL